MFNINLLLIPRPHIVRRIQLCKEVAAADSLLTTVCS